MKPRQNQQQNLHTNCQKPLYTIKITLKQFIHSNNSFTILIIFLNLLLVFSSLEIYQLKRMSHQLFDAFQYQLNIGYKDQFNMQSYDGENSQQIISILINSTTNIAHAAKELCIKNRLSLQLVDILTSSIHEEVQKQILLKTKNQSNQQSFEYSIDQNKCPKSKKFKDRFCQYLIESSRQQTEEDNQTFRNSEFVIDPSTLNPFEEQNSFRPTYIKMLQRAFNEEQEANVQINQFSINQESIQQEHFNKTVSQKVIIHRKVSSNKRKSKQKVFEQLYNDFSKIESKKAVKRKQSLQKLTFKPKINQNSSKIVKMMKRQNPEYGQIWRRSSSKQNKKPFHSKSKSRSPFEKKKQRTTLKNKKQKSPLQNKKRGENNRSITKSKCTIKNQNSFFKSLNSNPFQQTQCSLNSTFQPLSIYQRGQMFRKQSMQKLSRKKQNLIQNQLQHCTFKPRLNN